ncbi:MAG: PA14 domain-containing protein, partial [Bacteroidota bacterium]
MDKKLLLIVALCVSTFVPVFAQQSLILDTDTTFLPCDDTPVALNIQAMDLSFQGLKYRYYNGTWNNLPDFSTLTPSDSGVVSNLDISVRNDNSYYGFVYEGYIYLRSSGLYTFYTTSDDGSKLWINGQEVVNNDGLHGARERSGQINLTAGLHAVEIHFFEKS